MSDETVLEFYTALGFEEIEIEDDLTALSLEIDPQGSYVLLTDEEGEIPETLRQTVVFACYTAAGAYQWSASFKNSFLFRDAWAGDQPVREKLAAISKRREDIASYR